jgi:hypothetical protein
LSPNQSAGVVYSRETALEIRRRSSVLQPLVDPDWMVLDAWGGNRGARAQDKSSAIRPLTVDALLSVCGDSRLGFVIAKENLGFDPLRHDHDGVWKDWNLYDCRRVRQLRQPA